MAHLQQLAIKYTVAAEVGNANGLKELTGLDMSIFEGANSNWDYAKLYVAKGDEISAMIADMNTKVPPLIDAIKKITSNSDVIFNHFVEAGYLTASQKNNVVQELTNIENILEEIKSILQTNHSVRKSQYNMNYSSTNPFAAVLGADIGSIIRLVQFKNSLTDDLKILQEELGPMFAEIGDSHAILEMLNALGSESNRAYVGQDMILLKGNGGNLIKVNISAAVRMYQQGHQLLEEKSRIVEALLSALNVELIDGFATEQLKVVRRIDNIESNPSTYGDYFDACSAPVGSSRSEIIGADVHEYLPSLQNIQFDGIHSVLQNEITNAKSFLATSRKAIEDLFSEDDLVAALFDYVPGGEPGRCTVIIL